MTRPRGIVVYGASGAGKSTLLHRLHDALASSRDIEFLPRLITRAPREDDVAWENIGIDRDALGDLFARGEGWFRWTKPFPDGSGEDYAFALPRRRVVVLGGNDALFTYPHLVRPSANELEGLTKVLVTCRRAIREQRLFERQPKLADRPVEAEVRLGDTPDQAAALADVVVENDDFMSDDVVAAIAVDLRDMAVRDQDAP